MERYIKEIEDIAKKYSMGQSDGYAHIMRICDAIKESNNIILVQEKAKALDKISDLYNNVSIFDDDGTDSKIFTSNVCNILCELEEFEKKLNNL